MKSEWSDREAREFVERYGPECGEELALRVYTARLIGRNPHLVLHGGGNVSVKGRAETVFGETVDVVHVKASGWDLASIEPAGLPAMELAPLQRLRSLSELTDDEMMNQARIRMLDSRAPNPSVEVLLHAFLPETFVDHTHADFVLELTNQPNGEDVVRDAMGERVAVLPWIMPGFPLALAVADAHDNLADCEAVVVCNHGLFTFAADAQASYEKMIEMVERARSHVDRVIGGVPPLLQPQSDTVTDMDEWVAAAIPAVRGAFAREDDAAGGWGIQRVIADWRGAPDLIAFSRDARAADLLGRGPITPDHVIRTKGTYVYLSRAEAGDPDACRGAVRRFAGDYAQYHKENGSDGVDMIDPWPRVAVVEGAGVIAFGDDKRAAAIAADIAEHTLRSIARVSAMGEYRPVSPADLWSIEYWPLERAKLDGSAGPLLAGQIGLVTGAGGAIGHGIADALLAAGAHVVITDVSEQRLAAAMDSLSACHAPERIRQVTADITNPDDVARIYDCCRLEFGGVDIVVPNAGIAHVSTLAEMDPAALRKVMDVNVTGTLNVIKEAARVFEAQGTGGSVVVQSSKNVFDPGAGFGAYSASKAGVHQLGKIAALELAPLGVRVNMINADAVFGDGEISSGLWDQVGPDRMRARGLDPDGLRRYYRERSMLKVSVTPAHVGQAVVFFASGATPTTGATLPVDAGIPGAFPR